MEKKDPQASLLGPATVVDPSASIPHSTKHRSLLGTEQPSRQEPLKDPIFMEMAKNYDNQSLTDDSDMSSNEYEEPLIIQLMESMFTRKKTVQEIEQMISAMNPEEIKAEIKRMAIQERIRIATQHENEVFADRMKGCEKLNNLINKENPQLTDSVFDKPNFEMRENPFY